MSKTIKSFEDSKYFTNRELSWIEFNDRVLEEARNADNPLLERANFLGITQSNVDEFFMVRVASLYKLVAADIRSTDASGMTPKKQLEAINKKEHEAVDKRYSTYTRSLVPLLNKQGIYLSSIKDLTKEQYDFIRRYFNNELFPVLTPMADDTVRPFPFISNDSLNIAIRLRDDKGKHDYATVRVPNIFARLIKLPGDENSFILLENVVKEFIGTLFDGYKVEDTATFRVTRDMDLDVAEKDTSDFLRSVQKQLQDREHGHVVRLEVESSINDKLLNHLVDKLKVSNKDAIYPITGPIDLTFLKKLSGLVVGHDDLRYKPFNAYLDPKLQFDQDIFGAIRQKDFLVHHPYDTFDAVLNFIKKASIDPKVLAIKMTLYRVSRNSPIIKYLGHAAQAGKQVTVLVELKARFDEENNLHWAKTLEQMGCHVIYGLQGLKTHTKLTLVIRRDEDGIRRYMHLATGNYNDVTAHFYTDIGLFTCNRDFGIDVTNIFNMLSGYSKPPYFRQIHISPKYIREFINQKLDQEITVAKAGRHAEVRMKMNSLSDPEIIAKLYEASHAGVIIHLIVRGICCLRTDIPDVSDNIQVHSIVGRFLEHSRIYYFYNDGAEDVYLASTDMMRRNLNRRVETLFPVLQDDIRKRVMHIFNILWDDNIKTRVLHNHEYSFIDRRGKAALNAQQYFMQEADEENIELKNAEEKAAAFKQETFTVMKKQDDDLNLDEDD